MGGFPPASGCGQPVAHCPEWCDNMHGAPGAQEVVLQAPMMPLLQIFQSLQPTIFVTPFQAPDSQNSTSGQAERNVLTWTAS